MSETLIAGRILFIGAHPDDVEIGCGGTAAKSADEGCTIAFAIASRENSDAIAKKRTNQARNAAKILNLSEAKGNLFFGDLPDTKLDQSRKQVREWLKKVSKDFKPDTVFFHRKDDHTDHQAIFKVSIGVFQSQNILLYYIPRPFPETPFQPNHAVDISHFIRKKIAMCKCHAGQAVEYGSEDSVRTSCHYFYQRSFGRKEWKTNGYAEWFKIYASRSSDSSNFDSNDPAVLYPLRLVRKANGTFRLED